MFCKNCGAPIKDGAKFCAKCGAPVITENVNPSIDQQTDHPANARTSEQGNNSRKGEKGLVIALASVSTLLVVVLVAGGIWFFTNRQGRDDSEVVQETNETETVQDVHTTNGTEIAQDEGDLYHNASELETAVTAEDSEEFTDEESVEEISNREDYKNAYREILRSYMANPDSIEPVKFRLGYLDEDDIPELFILEDSIHAAGVEIYTYYDNRAVDLGGFGSSGSISYAPKCNRFLSYYAGMGDVIYQFYFIENGQPSLYAELTCYFDGDEMSDYTINGSLSDANEFDAELEAILKEFEVPFEDISYDEAYEINEKNIESKLAVD